jgi:succinate dehydrogenase cytochrome b subunit
VTVPRRLFSLAGVFPLGLFLLEHTVLSTSALGGAHAFARTLRVLASPAALAAQFVLVLVPLGFHATYGVYLVVRRIPLRDPGPYSPRVRTAMRWTGVLALAFIVLHLYECRIAPAGAFDRAELAYSRMAEGLSSLNAGVPWRALFYLVGLGATLTHFGWGLWGYLGSRGSAPRRTIAGLTAVVAVVFALGATVVVSFATGTHPFWVPIDRGPNAELPCPSASP